MDIGAVSSSACSSDAPKREHGDDGDTQHPTKRACPDPLPNTPAELGRIAFTDGMIMGEGRAWEVTRVMESAVKNESPLCRGMVGKIKSNRVAMARHGPIFGQNEAYHLQEAF